MVLTFMLINFFVHTLNCTKSLILYLFCSWKYEKKGLRSVVTRDILQRWILKIKKKISREIMMASKIPIWLFQKGFGHILINNPAQQGLHHHYLVKRLKELPFPMKSMTLLHNLSFNEFSVRFFQGTYSLFIHLQLFFFIQYSQVKLKCILILAPWSFKL